jgi:excisionase family DNA binding protein
VASTRPRFRLDPDGERERRDLIESLGLADHVVPVRDEEETYLSTREVALLLRVNTATVRRWADAGKLAIRSSLGGHRMFLLSSVRQAMERTIGIAGHEPAVSES